MNEVLTEHVLNTPVVDETMDIAALLKREADDEATVTFVQTDEDIGEEVFADKAEVPTVH